MVKSLKSIAEDEPQSKIVANPKKYITGTTGKNNNTTKLLDQFKEQDACGPKTKHPDGILKRASLY